MDDILEQLCTVLEDELERQENVLAICKAQRQAVRTHHLESLNAKTSALELLIRDAVRAQGARTALFHQLVEAYEIPEDRQTLTGLIAETPEPWSTRLRTFQTQMRRVLSDIRVALHDCATSLRTSGRGIEQLLERFEGLQPQRGRGYTSNGAGLACAGLAPGLINQVG